MTSSCNVSIYLYLGMVYMYMSHMFMCILAYLGLKSFVKILISAGFILNILYLIKKSRYLQVDFQSFLEFSCYNFFFIVLFLPFNIYDHFFFITKFVWTIFQRLFIDFLKTFTVNARPPYVCKTFSAMNLILMKN